MDNEKSLIVWSSHKAVQEDPTALRPILFAPSISYVEDFVQQIGISPLGIVGNSQIQRFTNQLPSSLPYQEDARSVLASETSSHILLLAADTPYLQQGGILSALYYHKKQNMDMTLFSNDTEGTTGAGWYKREVLDALLKQCDSESLSLQEIQECGEKSNFSTGQYWAEIDTLLSTSTSRNRAILARHLRELVLEKHYSNHVEIPLEDGIMIGPFVQIGEGTTILPGTILKGKTIIGKNCEIGPNTQIQDSVVGENTALVSTYVEESDIGNFTKIGPMCHIRPNSNIGDHIKIGNFVEVKNSTIGDRTAVSHLTYVGDSDVGEGCNFGCGVITVNYNGENKFRTTIGNDVFIGCNSNMVAPVTIADHAYVAAGTTVTDDVPESALVIGRSKQVVKKDWRKSKNQ